MQIFKLPRLSSLDSKKFHHVPMLMLFCASQWDELSGEMGGKEESSSATEKVNQTSFYASLHRVGSLKEFLSLQHFFFHFATFNIDINLSCWWTLILYKLLRISKASPIFKNFELFYIWMNFDKISHISLTRISSIFET